MRDEDFSFDPHDEQAIVRNHNEKLEPSGDAADYVKAVFEGLAVRQGAEPEIERARRCSGSFAEGQARLARVMDGLTKLAERNGQ